MSEKKEIKKQKQLNIAIDENIADGVYSNLAIINHSTSEFTLAFGEPGIIFTKSTINSEVE